MDTVVALTAAKVRISLVQGPPASSSHCLRALDGVAVHSTAWAITVHVARGQGCGFPFPPPPPKVVFLGRGGVPCLQQGLTLRMCTATCRSDCHNGRVRPPRTAEISFVAKERPGTGRRRCPEKCFSQSQTDTRADPYENLLFCFPDSREQIKKLGRISTKATCYLGYAAPLTASAVGDRSLMSVCHITGTPGCSTANAPNRHSLG